MQFCENTMYSKALETLMDSHVKDNMRIEFSLLEMEMDVSWKCNTKNVDVETKLSTDWENSDEISPAIICQYEWKSDESLYIFKGKSSWTVSRVNSFKKYF